MYDTYTSAERKKPQTPQNYDYLWQVELKCRSNRFHSYFKEDMNTLIQCPLANFFSSTHRSTMQRSLHPPWQFEAWNIIRSITEPLEISAFSACSEARDGETDMLTYGPCTHPQQIAQVWDDQWEQSCSTWRGCREAHQRPCSTYTSKTSKENMLEAGICVPWTKIFTVLLSTECISSELFRLDHLFIFISLLKSERLQEIALCGFERNKRWRKIWRACGNNGLQK